MEKSELEGGGTLRRLHLAGGGELVERLERRDDGARVISYSIVQGPLPVADYHATLTVREADEGKACTVEWTSEFEPAGVPADEAIRIIEDIYRAGLENLKRMFGASS